MGNMKILMLVTGDASRDTRVQYEKNTLTINGHSVKIKDWKHKHQNKLFTILLLIKWWITTYRYYSTLDFDIVHCHDFDTLLVGVLLKKKTKCKLIYDAHELYAYMTNIRIILPFEKLLLKNVDRCITVHEKVASYIYNLGGVNLDIVRNCKPQMNTDYKKPKNYNGLIISYFGILSYTRMFPELIDTIGNIPHVYFIVGGYGKEYEKVKNKCKQYGNIAFRGWQPEKEVLRWTQLSDAVICMLNPSNINCCNGMPNKLYECLVTGRPLITTKNTFAGKKVTELECGYIVEYNAQDIQQLLMHMLYNKDECRKLGQNAFRHGKDEYNWEKEKKKLIKIYEELI